MAEGRGGDELDQVVLDEEFVRSASVSEPTSKERARRARRARGVLRGRRGRRPRRGWRLPQLSGRTFAALVVVISGAGLVALGRQGQGPLASSLHPMAAARVATPPAPATTVATDLAPTTTSTTMEQLEGGPWPVGQCVTWDQTVSNTMATAVPCATPHLLEVTGTTRYQSSSTDYPSEAAWNAWADSGVCSADGVAFLGHKLDPEGRFQLGFIRPVPVSWSAGDREVTCGLELARDTPLFLTATGSFKGQDAGWSRPPGTCTTATLDGHGTADVPCSQAHLDEIVGSVDLTGRYGSVPTDQQWQDVSMQDCLFVANAYLGHPFHPTGGEQVVVGRIQPEGWADGTRRAECFVVQFDSAGHAVPRTGSVKG